MVWRAAILIFVAATAAVAELDDGENSDVRVLVSWLLEDGRDLEEIPFPELILAATGRKVLAFDQTGDAVRAKLETAIQRVVDAVNDGNHPVREAGRINEAGGYIEAALLEELDGMDGWNASIPTTADGRTLRSGYPDIRVEMADGRIFYIDPKLYADGSGDSSFRTFYYEPKVDTNKVTDDACHLVLGLRHNRSPGDGLRILGWELIDLNNVKIRLKPEFQAANRDLYRDETRISEWNGDERDE